MVTWFLIQDEQISSQGQCQSRSSAPLKRYTSSLHKRKTKQSAKKVQRCLRLMEKAPLWLRETFQTFRSFNCHNSPTREWMEFINQSASEISHPSSFGECCIFHGLIYASETCCFEENNVGLPISARRISGVVKLLRCSSWWPLKALKKSDDQQAKHRSRFSMFHRISPRPHLGGRRTITERTKRSVAFFNDCARWPPKASPLFDVSSDNKILSFGPWKKSVSVEEWPSFTFFTWEFPSFRVAKCLLRKLPFPGCLTLVSISICAFCTVSSEEELSKSRNASKRNISAKLLSKKVA